MSFVIGAVTLPQFPHKIEEKNPSETKVRALPGNVLPIVVSPGRALRTLELEVYIYSPGLTNAQLLSTYITPLRNLVQTVVAVTSPDSIYNGNYLLDSFNPVPVVPGVFKATIKLIQGSQMLVF